MRGLPHGAAAPVENDRLTTLARRLAAATSVRDAEWQLREPELYAWSSNDGSISIASRDRDGEAPYELIVHNAAGKQVDELSWDCLRETGPLRGTTRSPSFTWSRATARSPGASPRALASTP